MVMPVAVRFAGNDVLRAEGEREVTEPDHGARAGDRRGRRREGEQEAADGLYGTADHQERCSAPVGQPSERDREEDRQQRERRRYEPDLARALSVGE